MIKNFFIINFTGKNDSIGLKVDNNFFITPAYPGKDHTYTFSTAAKITFPLPNNLIRHVFPYTLTGIAFTHWPSPENTHAGLLVGAGADYRLQPDMEQPEQWTGNEESESDFGDIQDFNQLINEESSIDSKFVIFLATFLNEASSIEIKNISSYWGIEKNIQKQWDELSKANYELNMFDADNGSNSKLNQILINCNLQICISLSQHLNPILSKRIYEYWNTLKNLKPHLTSSELIHMGICEGPLLGKAIQELNNQVIDKKLKTKKDEIEFVKKFTNLD